MKKSSVRNLMIATGIVAVSGYVLKKIIDSKKRVVMDKGETEILKKNGKNDPETIEKEENKSRKYHTLYVYKKSPIEK